MVRIPVRRSLEGAFRSVFLRCAHQLEKRYFTCGNDAFCCEALLGAYTPSVPQREMVFRVTNTAFASSPWDIPSRSRCSLMRFASSTRIPSNLEVSDRGNCTIEPVWRARSHAKMACQKICATMLSWHVFEQTVGAAACTRELVVLELREEALEASRPEGRIHADRTYAIHAYSRRTGTQISLYALRSAKRNAGNSTILYSLVCLHSACAPSMAIHLATPFGAQPISPNSMGMHRASMHCSPQTPRMKGQRHSTQAAFPTPG